MFLKHIFFSSNTLSNDLYHRGNWQRYSLLWIAIFSILKAIQTYKYRNVEMAFFKTEICACIFTLYIYIYVYIMYTYVYMSVMTC